MIDKKRRRKAKSSNMLGLKMLGWMERRERKVESHR
jgi:hypothetical protein